MEIASSPSSFRFLSRIALVRILAQRVGVHDASDVGAWMTVHPRSANSLRQHPQECAGGRHLNNSRLTLTLGEAAELSR
jgi:hypothetical protein